ncbi:MAG: glycosyltransferase family 2 protein [Lachnotalea sp.]
MKYNTNHTFAVCAYKETEFLEKCVKSLVNQTVKSNIIICTSTPCDFIENMADKYELPLYVREGKSDIQDDWNFACDCADTDWVTVAHQDDFYHPEYETELVKNINQYPDAIMAFTDYRPVKQGKITKDINCKVRHLFRTPMKSSFLANIKFFKKYFLSFGNCICCPAVAYNKSLINGPIFTSNLKFALDWDTFLKYAQKNGRFLYIDKPLTFYRIHNEATTKEFIVDNKRVAEDIEMFVKFWPQWVTKILMKYYVKAYETYTE